MDYVQWVQRLRGFILGLQERSPPGHRDRFSIEIAPPLQDEEIEELAESLDCGLPPPLQEFLRTGASSISFQYAWPTEDDETSDTFCPADQLAEWREECVEYATESWLMEPDWPLDQALWRHALPLVHYPDGDGVALWVHDPDHPNPAVIYLKHEDESFLLSRNFDEFLHHWERLGYTGTNDLEQYRHPESGFLDSTTAQAVAFRKALGL
jgi:SMI1 / KNR4 family (SUKH-1)